MARGSYDIITVGGGLGGATLAKMMSEHGARVREDDLPEARSRKPRGAHGTRDRESGGRPA